MVMADSRASAWAIARERAPVCGELGPDRARGTGCESAERGTCCLSPVAYCPYLMAVRAMAPYAVEINPRTSLPSLLNVCTERVRPMFQLVRASHSQNQKVRAARDLLLPRLISGEIGV